MEHAPHHHTHLFLQCTRLPILDDAVNGAKGATPQLAGDGEAVDNLWAHFYVFPFLSFSS